MILTVLCPILKISLKSPGVLTYKIRRATAADSGGTVLSGCCQTVLSVSAASSLIVPCGAPHRTQIV